MTRLERRSAAETAPLSSTRDRPWPPGLILFGAVLAISWGGPLVRFTDAAALAVSMWRVLLAVLVIAVVLVWRGGWRSVLELSRGEWALAAVSGLMLAAHFWSWITSLEWTSVASSVVLVSTQPIFVAALSALLLGELPSRQQWAGLVIAVVGTAIIGWGDLGQGRSTLVGNVLALGGALFAAAYFIVGRQLRPRLDFWVYTGVVYGVAAVALMLAVVASPGVSLLGYGGRDWLVFAALAAGPMLLGHGGINYALRYLPAYVAILAIVGEPVGATLIAWWIPAIGEVPSPQLVVGGVLVGAGVLLGVYRRPAKRPARRLHD